MVFFGHFDASGFHDGRCDVADMVILAANFTFRLDAIGPMHDEVIRLTAAMLALLEISKRRIAGHRPARVVMRIRVLATPVFLGTQVSFHRRLQPVQYVGFIERTSEPTLATRAIIRCDKD